MLLRQERQHDDLLDHLRLLDLGYLRQYYTINAGVVKKNNVACSQAASNLYLLQIKTISARAR